MKKHYTETAAMLHKIIGIEQHNKKTVYLFFLWQENTPNLLWRTMDLLWYILGAHSSSIFKSAQIQFQTFLQSPGPLKTFNMFIVAVVILRRVGGIFCSITGQG